MIEVPAAQAPSVRPLTPTFNVADRVRSVAAYAAMEEGQDRPLLCLLGGGFLTLVSLALIIFIAYHTIYLHATGTSGAMFWLGIAFFPYATGAFVFSLGYEFNDVGRALRLTLVIVVTSVVFLAIASVALVLLLRPGAAVSALGGDRGRNALGLVTGLVDENNEADIDAAENMFTVTCQRCGERFIPLPPQAICPSCGWQAVTVA